MRQFSGSSGTKDEQSDDDELLRSGSGLGLGLGRGPDVSLLAEEVPKALSDAIVRERIGLELEPADGGGYAVVKVREGSGAERIGLEPGDLILGINGRALADDGALRRAALDLRGRSRALVVVARGGGRYHVTIPLL